PTYSTQGVPRARPTYRNERPEVRNDASALQRAPTQGAPVMQQRVAPTAQQRTAPAVQERAAPVVQQRAAAPVRAERAERAAPERAAPERTREAPSREAPSNPAERGSRSMQR